MTSSDLAQTAIFSDGQSSDGHLHGDLAVRRVALDLEVGEGALQRVGHLLGVGVTVRVRGRGKVRVRVRAEVRGRVSLRLGRGRRWRRRAPCTAALLQLGDLLGLGLRRSN